MTLKLCCLLKKSVLKSTKHNRLFFRPILFREMSLLQTLQILVLGVTLILLVVAICLQETMVLPAPIALPILVFPTIMLQISICLGTPLNIRSRFVSKLVIQRFVVGTGMIRLNNIPSLLTCLNFLLTQMNNPQFLEHHPLYLILCGTLIVGHLIISQMIQKSF